MNGGCHHLVTAAGSFGGSVWMSSLDVTPGSHDDWRRKGGTNRSVPGLQVNVSASPLRQPEVAPTERCNTDRNGNSQRPYGPAQGFNFVSASSSDVMAPMSRIALCMLSPSTRSLPVRP